VADVVAAVLALMATKTATGGVFNIGSDQPVTILELAQRVIAAVNPRVAVRFENYAEAYSPDFEDVRARVPDLTKLRRTIGYQPRYDLDQMIAAVIADKRIKS
jgi:UDP-glucose 4-epimerase